MPSFLFSSLASIGTRARSVIYESHSGNSRAMHHISLLSPLWGALWITLGALLAITAIRKVAAENGSLKKVFRRAPKAEPNGKAQFQGLLVGTDNRFSTSKLNAFLWTVTLVYFIVSMALISGFNADAFNKLVQSTSTLYLVLIGGPFAAAILAKGIVSGAVNAGMPKSAAKDPSVTNIFSDDDGNTDLVDTQYVLFNLIAVLIVIAEFVRSPNAGPPKIPGFLAVLTGASAATYVANKGVSTANNTPFSGVLSISNIVPPEARIGDGIKILGSNLMPQGSTAPPIILIAGFQAGVKGTPTSTEIDCIVPSGIAAGDCKITVRTSAGTEADAADMFKVLDGQER